jgi:hypothetical protein
VRTPWLTPQWKIPHVSAAFVAAMEEVLAVYAAPYDPDDPQVNFDETSRQLLADVPPPLPAHVGQPQREDAEYQRMGTRNLFMHGEPRYASHCTGWMR